jgi:2-keto-4-pentenoate hydratase
VKAPADVLGVDVRGRDHLREVDHRDVLLLVHQQVELVEVAVDEAVLGHPHNQVHQLVEDGRRVAQGLDRVELVPVWGQRRPAVLG